MERDWFAILGLAPGRYEPAEIARRFHAQRVRVLAAMNDPRQYAAARRRLEELHLAYAALRDPDAQAEHLRAQSRDDDAVRRLRRLIAASLEDGLLRYSRRQEILAQAARLGFSPFQTQLLIAQVQFGDEIVPAPRPSHGPAPQPHARHGRPRTWARLAAVGVLALALFLALVRWLGV